MIEKIKQERAEIMEKIKNSELKIKQETNFLLRLQGAFVELNNLLELSGEK